MDETPLLTLNEQNQKKIESLIEQSNKRNSRALWKTRIKVSFITALITSVLISIPVTYFIQEDTNSTTEQSIKTNCKNLQRTNSASRAVIVRAEMLQNAQLKKTGQIKEEKTADAFYNWAISQYDKVQEVGCPRL